LITAELNNQGWYVETRSGRVEDLATAIWDHLPSMLVGEKVMILDTNGYTSGGKI